MKQNSCIQTVREIMDEFADLTGISSSTAPRRYLWTDAFAVCNFLEIHNRTGGPEYLQLALRLVDQVHHVLGRYRPDDARKGWISGLSEKEGEKHPTAGGLRIGKELNERRPAEPFDERLEWDRDGQYYHYLTKWMHALNCVSRVTGEPIYNTWAIELAKTAYAKFTFVPPSGGPKRMYWKMSTDLSYPLVPSMGHHDPLDGFIAYNELQATAKRYFRKETRAGLGAEISDMAKICKGRDWVTEDPLGLGDLLCNAHKAAQLAAGGDLEQRDLPGKLLESAMPGLESFEGKNLLRLPAVYRLPFRELGLAIGLKAVDKIGELVEQNPAFFKGEDLLRPVKVLAQYTRLPQMIERFWLEQRTAGGESWIGHRDINMVMLATSLAPDAYLTL